MAHVIIRHKIADFGKWKPVYEDHRLAREAAGLTDLHLWRNENNPADVLLLFEASDMVKARAFLASSDIKERMKAAGVQGPPEIVFLSEG